MRRVKQAVHHNFGTLILIVRWTKAQHERNVLQPSGESQIPSPQALITDKCFNKKITTGRKINFTFLENEGFDFGNRLIKMSWRFLCSLNIPTYPRLVKEFYNTLVEVEDGCRSMVGGKSLYIIVDVMS